MDAPELELLFAEPPSFFAHPDLIAQCEALGCDMSGITPITKLPPFQSRPTATTEGVRKVLEGIGGA
jgi:hypothetical protein